MIPPFEINDANGNYKWKGLNTATKDNRSLERGEAQSELNWITGRKGDYIALRRGSQLLGTTNRDPSANKTKVTGLGIGTLENGVEVPFFSAGRSIYYYDEEDDETYETNTVNIIPAAADGEDVHFNPYTNLAGSFIYAGSPHSTTFKIPVANPAYPVDQRVLNYRFGFAKINKSRTYGMNRKGELATSFDPTGVYLSWIDKQTFSDYPTQQVNLVQGSGDGTTKAFSGSSISGAMSGGIVTYFATQFAAPIQAGSSISAITKASSAVITAAGHGLVYGDLVMVQGADMTQINGIFLQVTAVSGNDVTVSIDSTSFSTYTTGGSIYKIELFNDDKNGVLTSNLGGTGTINYATGAWTLTFNTAPINASNNIIANTNYENSTVEGVLDFSYNQTSRVPGTGNLFRQDDGAGTGKAIWPYQGVEYCFHVLRSYVVDALDTTDTLTSNLPYYEQIGIPYERAAFPTSDGVVFLDNSNPANPKVSILQIQPGTTSLTIVPVSLSTALDLTGFAYDYCVVRRWGEFDIMSCQNLTNGQVDTYNSKTFIRNIYSGVWNELDYRISCADEFYGALLAGDTISPNVYVLFSGLDDDGEVISNFRKSGYVNLNIDGLKKVNYLNLRGLIQRTQSLEVYISLDQGEYVKVYTIVGTGAYVSQANPVGVGSFTMGSNVVGGGGGAIFANPFEIDIPIHTDRFEYISFMVKAIDVGYIQIDHAAYKDIRWKRKRLASYNDPEIS